MTKRNRLLVVAMVVAPAALLAGSTWRTYRHYRIDEPPRLGASARVEAMRVARVGLEHERAERPDHPELERRLPHRGPVVITVWLDGRMTARADGFGDTLADALFEAAGVLPSHPGMDTVRGEPGAAARARLQIDVVSGRGPLADGMLRAVSLNPGKEGVGVTLNGVRNVTLLPHDLVMLRLLHVKQPISFIKDFKLGFDFERADHWLATFAALPPGGYGQAHRRYYRFRTDSFVEPASARAEQAPLPLTRGLPPGPELSASSLREGALAGGRYLVQHLSPEGRYIYEVDLNTGRGTDPTDLAASYSVPRHAGTTYFLAELYRITGAAWLREPIERAFGHMAELVAAGGCRGTLPSGAEYACVIDRGRTVANLGSTALGVVALAEYRRATGDPRYDVLLRELSEFLLFMQREDGSFMHLFDVASASPDDAAMLLYFSGEAALALARMYVLFEDPRYLQAVERSLDWLVAWYDGFFAGAFFIGEEHWTCIASEAIHPHLTHDRYRQFCDDYGAFLRQQQPEPGENPGQDDLAGAYGVTPFFVPNNTPVGSRTEAMISAYLLGRYHGRPNPAMRRQILAAMSYALRQQIRDDSAWNVPREVEGIGALTHSGIDRTVRIDFVQHVCSAMIRASELLEAESNGARERE